ncbi:MAG TPA: hypothetical protein VFT13_06005, partial [Candidatus Krumholzibacteria bacterium]|nr:hypothetical protein [Candidatus Krumholzibacteria bacterium]
MRRPASAALGIATLLMTSWTVQARADSSTSSYSAEVDVRLETVRNLIAAKDYAGAKKMAEDVTVTTPTLPDGWMLLG